MNEDTAVVDIRWARLLWVAFYVMLAIILYTSFTREFKRDEFESIHASWKILHGERIYVDFFEHHHPLYYYLLVPVLALFKETITTLIACRMLSYLLLLAIFAVVYRIARTVFNKETGLISLIVLSGAAVFIHKASDVKPDVPQVLFGLLAVACLFNYLENKSVRSLMLSALSLSIAFLFLEKAAILILIIGGFLLISACKRRIPYRDAIVYSLIFVSPLIIYCVYLFFDGSLRSYLICTWGLNVRWVLLDIFYVLRPTFNFVLESYKTNCALWFFWVLAPFFLKTKNQKRIGVLSLVLVATFFIINRSHEEYILSAIPFIAIISAFVINAVFRENKNMIAALLIISLAYPSYDILTTPRQDPNCGQLQKVAYVLAITKPDDFVYDGRNEFNVFRKDADFFWFSPTNALPVYALMYPYDFDIYKIIDKYRPKVISTFLIKNIKDARIANNYVRSKEYKGLLIRTGQ